MIIVLCTFPRNKSIVSNIIKILLDRKLAACISTLYGVHSFYYWENTLQNHSEIQLIIKTNKSLKEKVFKTIKTLHPYKVPELLVLSVSEGDKNYLSWIQSTLQ